MNHLQSTAIFCLGKVARHTDLMEARERIKSELKKGKIVTDMIKDQKGEISLSARLSQVGKTIFDLVNDNTAKAEQKSRNKGKAVKAAMTAMIAKGDEVHTVYEPSPTAVIPNLKNTTWDYIQVSDHHTLFVVVVFYINIFVNFAI